MVDLPLVYEHTGVFGNEISVEWRVFRRTERQKHKQSTFFVYKHPSPLTGFTCGFFYTFMMPFPTHQWGMVNGRNEEWRKISRMKASRYGRSVLSDKRGARSIPIFSSRKIIMPLVRLNDFKASDLMEIQKYWWHWCFMIRRTDSLSSLCSRSWISG